MFIDSCFTPEDNFRRQFFAPVKSGILRLFDLLRITCPLCIQSDSTLICCGIDTGRERLN